MFKKLKRVGLLSGMAIAMTLGLTTVNQAMASDDFATSWEAADAERKAAAQVGFEWRDTKKLLKQAKKANEEGDTEKAIKLVAKAHEQSSDAIAQHKRESDLWMSRVPE